MSNPCNNIVRAYPHLDVTTYPVVHNNAVYTHHLHLLDPVYCHETVVTLHPSTTPGVEIGILIQDSALVNDGTVIHLVNLSGNTSFAIYYLDPEGTIQPCWHVLERQVNWNWYRKVGQAPVVRSWPESNDNMVTVRRVRPDPDQPTTSIWLSNKWFQYIESNLRFYRPTMDFTPTTASIVVPPEGLNHLVMLRHDYDLVDNHTTLTLPNPSSLATIKVGDEFTVYNSTRNELSIVLDGVQHRYLSPAQAMDTADNVLMPGASVRFVLVSKTPGLTWVVIPETQ